MQPDRAKTQHVLAHLGVLPDLSLIRKHRALVCLPRPVIFDATGR